MDQRPMLRDFVGRISLWCHQGKLGKSPRKMEVFHWETPGEIMGNLYFYGGFNVEISSKKMVVSFIAMELIFIMGISMDL